MLIMTEPDALIIAIKAATALAGLVNDSPQAVWIQVRGSKPISRGNSHGGLRMPDLGRMRLSFQRFGHLWQDLLGRSANDVAA